MTEPLTGPLTGRVLVAGVGNIFLGDDGFGVEVARRLAGTELPDGNFQPRTSLSMQCATTGSLPVACALWTAPVVETVICTWTFALGVVPLERSQHVRLTPCWCCITTLVICPSVICAPPPAAVATTGAGPETGPEPVWRIRS